MRTSLYSDSRIAAGGKQVSCELAGEVVLLQLDSGIYYGLDPVGSRVWQLLQEPRSFAELQDALLAEFEVEPERCAGDLRVLLGELDAAGLIEVQKEAEGSSLRSCQEV